MINRQDNRWIVLLMMLVSFSYEAYSQQDAQYTQFMYNKLPQNPGYTGAREVLSIRALYRDQWSGNKNGGISGAPKTTSFSIHSPFKREHFAMGFFFLYDRLGLEHKNQFNVTYAYRLNLGKKVKMSLGLNAGLLWYKYNGGGAITIDPDPISTNNVSKVLADVGAGLYIYHPNFYFGASVPNFIRGDLETVSAGGDTKRTPHFVFMAGGAIPAGKVLYIRPQIQYRYLANAEGMMPHTLDVNLSFLIYNRVNIGGQYRTSAGNKNEGVKLKNPDSFDFMLEVWPIKQLMIGYAYDYTLTKLGSYNRGSHEIMIGYDLALEKKKVITPRYF